MNSPASQFRAYYIVMKNCGTDINCAIGVTLLMLALLVNKLYNVNVSIVSKDAKSLFISVRKGRLGTESCFWQLTVETAEPSFLVEIKL